VTRYLGSLPRKKNIVRVWLVVFLVLGGCGSTSQSTATGAAASATSQATATTSANPPSGGVSSAPSALPPHTVRVGVKVIFHAKEDFKEGTIERIEGDHVYVDGAALNKGMFAWRGVDVRSVKAGDVLFCLHKDYEQWGDWSACTVVRTEGGKVRVKR
jgi:hypothetical protein